MFIRPAVQKQFLPKPHHAENDPKRRHPINTHYTGAEEPSRLSVPIVRFNTLVLVPLVVLFLLIIITHHILIHAKHTRPRLLFLIH